MINTSQSHLSRVKTLLFQNQSTKQTIVKNTFWLAIAEGISKLFSIIQTLQITRYLGVEGYGIYSFAISFVSLFSVLADFGFGTLLIRDIAKNKLKIGEYLVNLTILKLLLSTVSLVLIFGSTIFLGKSQYVLQVVILGGVAILLQNFLQFFHSVYRVFEKMQIETFSRIAYSVLLFILVQLVILANLGLLALMEIFIVAGVLSVVLNIVIFKRLTLLSVSHINSSTWKKFLKNSWAFALAAVANYIYFRIDITMLSIMRDDRSVGLYSAAYNFVLVLNILPTVINPSLFGSISRLASKNVNTAKKFLVRGIWIIFVVGLLSSIFMWKMSGFITNLIFGPKFQGIENTIFILLLSSVCLITDRLLFDYFAIIHKQTANTMILVFATILNISINLWMIPHFGFFGAAISTLITEAAILGMSLAVFIQSD